MDILNDLFYGRISPWNDKIPQSEDLFDAKTAFDEKTGKFKEFLLTLPNAEEAVGMYVDVVTANLAVIDIEYYEYFVKGWKMCARLMTESIS